MLGPLVASVMMGCATTTAGSHTPSKARPTSSSLPDPGQIPDIISLVQISASRFSVPMELVLGVIQVESSFQPRARSTQGARGLMQLMPQTAASIAHQLGYEQYDLEDPTFNIEAGTFYLAYVLRLFSGDLHRALAAYNSGPERALRWAKNGQPISAGAAKYVTAVLAARDQFLTNGFAVPAQAVATNQLEPRSASTATPASADLDREGLRTLLHQQEQLYGERPDEPLPTEEGIK